MSDHQKSPLNPAIVARWRAASGPVIVRLIVLDGKAENDGLTEDERAEHAWLQEESGRLLREFLRELRENDND